MNKRTVLSTILLALGILFVQAKDYKYTTVPGDLMNTRITHVFTPLTTV